MSKKSDSMILVYILPQITNRCNYDSPDNRIYLDPLTNEYYLDIETSEWDEYDDGFVHQREYIAYIRKFPTKQFLGLLGYEVQEYEYLDYNAPVDAPQSLFKED